MCRHLVKWVCVVGMTCWIFSPRKAALAGVVAKNAFSARLR